MKCSKNQTSQEEKKNQTKKITNNVKKKKIRASSHPPNSTNAEDKTRENLDANKSHIPKSLCKKCQEVQLLLMLIIKPLMPHKVMKVIQWKQKKKTLEKIWYLSVIDTVQRHHTISVSSKRC